MKTMTCKQLGGVCDKEFHANTFEEMANLGKTHGMKMYEQNERAHIKVMKEMRGLMTNPEAMKKWMESKQKEFDELPEDKMD